MAHIIQPISIEGTKYCLTCQTGQATIGVATDITGGGFPNGASHDTDGSPISGFVPCGPWRLATVFAGPDLCGEISFGVSCVATVEVTLTLDGESGPVDYEIFLNGVSYVTGTVTATDAIETITISSGACGSVITVNIEAQSGSPYVGLAITSIT